MSALAACLLALGSALVGAVAGFLVTAWAVMHGWLRGL